MDLLKNNVVAGVGLAFAAAVLAPVLLPAMTRIGRPLAKSLVRGGMMMYEKGREAMAVAGESVEDLMAEVRAEGAMAGAPRPAAPAQAAPQASQAPASQPAPPYGGNGAAAGGPVPDGATAAEAKNP